MNTTHTQRTVWTLALPIVLLVGHPTSAQETNSLSVKETDKVRAKIQKLCPVSGLELGAHGPPIKVKIGGQQLFVCCESCKTGKVKQEHWTKIHQNFATAQSKCLVMDNPLPKKPKWVIVNGQLIYVCCPPCIEKLKASPDEYLQQLNRTYSKFLSSQPGNNVKSDSLDNTQ